MAEYPTSSSSSPPQPLPLHQTPSPIIPPKSQPLQSQLQQQRLQFEQKRAQLHQRKLQEIERLSQQLNGSSKIINTDIGDSSFQSNPSTSRVHDSTDQLRIKDNQFQQLMEQVRCERLHRLRCQIRMMHLIRVHAAANCGKSSTQVSINQLGGKRKIEDLLSELDLNEKEDLDVGDPPSETADNFIHLEGAVSVQSYKFHPGASPVQSIRGLEMTRSRNLSSQVRPKKPLASYTKPIRMTTPPQQLISWQMLSHQIAGQVGTIAGTSFTNAGLMRNASTGEKRLKRMLPPISSSSCSSCLPQPQHLQNLQRLNMQQKIRLLLLRQQLASSPRPKAVNLRGSQPDAAAATAASPAIAPTASSIIRPPVSGSNGRMDCDVEDLADDFVDVVRLTDSQNSTSNP